MAKKSWATHNNNVFKNGLIEYKAILEKRLQASLREVALVVRDLIQGGEFTPLYTGNMQDSTGLAVYCNGVASSFVPFAIANEPQTYNKKTIWGEDLLQDALQAGANNYRKGLWIVIFSAVPYAFKVDTNGSKYHEQGYFSKELTSRLISELKIALARNLPNMSKNINSI